MTRLEALEALAEKVAAGTAEFDWTADYWPRGEGFCLPADSCSGAYLGSLDAAKVLHDAMLPGWGAIIHLSGRVTVFENLITDEYTGVIPSDPARAWLLAILNALIAREQTKNEP